MIAMHVTVSFSMSMSYRDCWRLSTTRDGFHFLYLFMWLFYYFVSCYTGWSADFILIGIVSCALFFFELYTSPRCDAAVGGIAVSIEVM